MAVYYRFKSEAEICLAPIPIEDASISVANLKEKIIAARKLENLTHFDLIFTNSETKEDYVGEATLIPRNTSVIVRRVPGRSHMTIATNPEEKKTVPDTVKNDESAESTITAGGGSATFVPEVTPTRADEDSKIKALVDTPALDRQRQPQEGYYAGRGFGRPMGGKTIGRGRGFGRGGFELEPVPSNYTCYRCGMPGHLIQHCPFNVAPGYGTDHRPPKGYICRRCKVPGHFVQCCPTNGNPKFDIKKAKPNEAALMKEMEKLPSTTRSIGDLSELCCPLCKNVMTDAVLSSKCCFRSFCDKCIRDCITTTLKCDCGATGIIPGDLVPNNTLREAINRVLESNNSSAAIAGREKHIQGSAASRGELGPAPHKDGNSGIEETRSKAKNDSDASETTRASMGVKELGTQGKSQMAESEMRQKVFGHEPDTHRKTTHDPAAGNYNPYQGGMYNPYQGGTQQPGTNGYINPNASMIPQDPFGRGYELPVVPPQRETLRDRNNGGEMSSSAGVPSMISRSRPMLQPPPSFMEHNYHHQHQQPPPSFMDHNYHYDQHQQPPPSFMDHGYHQQPPPSFVDHSHHHQHQQPPPSFVDHSYHHQHQQPPPSFVDHNYHRQHQPSEWPWNPEHSQSSSRPIRLGKRKAYQGEEYYEAGQVAAAANIRNNRGNVFPRSSAYPHNHHLSSSTGYNYHNEHPEAPSFAGASHHHHRHHRYRLSSSATGHHNGRHNEANASTQPSYGRSTRNQSNMRPDDRKWRGAGK